MVGLRDVYVVAPAASFHPAAVPAHHEQFHSSAEAHSIIPLLTAAPYLVDDAARAARAAASIVRHTSKAPGFPPPADVSAISPLPIPPPPPPPLPPQFLRSPVSYLLRQPPPLTHPTPTLLPLVASTPAQATRATTSYRYIKIIACPLPSTLSQSLFYFSDPSFRENLPGHVRAPAVFKCVRVTSIDDGEDEYAYHAKVNIGGHVFKGFLYNQGFDEGIRADLTGTSTAVDVANNVNNTSNAIPNFSDLHLGGGGVRNVPHSDIYDFGALLGGAAFGNAIN